VIDVALILLILALLAGLIMVPFGLPGLWLMVGATIVFGAATGFAQVGFVTIAIVVLLAAIAEGFEAWLGFRFAKRFGGSTRAGWGAMLGGLIGAFVGTPVPIVGNVVGAFVGAFAGAVVFEYLSNSDVRKSLGAGWGALLGRAAGAALKVTTGIIIAIIAIYAALG